MQAFLYARSFSNIKTMGVFSELYGFLAVVQISDRCMAAYRR